MRMIVVFTEELSAKVMLQSLLPRIVSVDKDEVHFQCIAFEGKQDLKKQLPIKLRGWGVIGTRFIVLCDQDNDDCVALKQELQRICDTAGKPDALIRIVCRELESWYFGDLASVGSALGISNLESYQQKAKYRVPDVIMKPDNELKRITNGEYQKIGGSRLIGKCLSLDDSSSVSYTNFISGVRRVIRESEER